MSLSHRLLAPLFRQFHQPEGVLGSFVGRALARKGARAYPVVEAAALQPTDRVLDIGCGPGVAVARAASEVPAGHVTGIDPSDVMVRQATRRTRDAANVTITTGTAESIPLGDDSVDVVWATNTFHHWADTAAGLAEVRRVLRPGGRLLVMEQSHGGRRGSALSDEATAALVDELAAGGFEGAEVTTYTSGGETHTLVRVVASATARS